MYNMIYDNEYMIYDHWDSIFWLIQKKRTISLWDTHCNMRQSKSRVVYIYEADIHVSSTSKETWCIMILVELLIMWTVREVSELSESHCEYARKNFHLWFLHYNKQCNSRTGFIKTLSKRKHWIIITYWRLLTIDPL